MENLQELARTYRRILKLKSDPVAVKIIRKNEETPVLFKRPEAPLPGICFAVMEAFKGKGLYCTRADLSCVMGLIALGFKGESALPSTYRHPVHLGVFESREAARRYFSNGFQLPAAQTRAVALSPLEKAVMGVDVILFKCDADQTRWLFTANQYRSGERDLLALGTGYQSICGHGIAYPYLQRKVNLTLNGVGDRTFSLLGKNEFLIGIPEGRVVEIAANLAEIQGKPIFKLRPTSRNFPKANAGRGGPRP